MFKFVWSLEVFYTIMFTFQADITCFVVVEYNYCDREQLYVLDTNRRPANWGEPITKTSTLFKVCIYEALKCKYKYKWKTVYALIQGQL